MNNSKDCCLEGKRNENNKQVDREGSPRHTTSCFTLLRAETSFGSVFLSFDAFARRLSTCVLIGKKWPITLERFLDIVYFNE